MTDITTIIAETPIATPTTEIRVITLTVASRRLEVRNRRARPGSNPKVHHPVAANALRLPD